MKLTGNPDMPVYAYLMSYGLNVNWALALLPS